MHRTLKWTASQADDRLAGEGAARALSRCSPTAAQRAGAPFILTAHTLDDQAETVLFRMARGSGLTGLAGMARGVAGAGGRRHRRLYRPLLDISKARLIATLEGAADCLRGRSFQPRSALHPRALRAPDAASGARRARRSAAVRAGAAAAARRMRRWRAVVDQARRMIVTGEGMADRSSCRWSISRLAGRNRAAAAGPGGQSGRARKGRWNSASWRALHGRAGHPR